MSSLLSSAGAASEELTRVVHDEWAAAANRAGVDLAGFDPAAPLAERIAWAGSVGFDVATVYARSNRRHPQPVADQVRECAAFAASNRMYVPPELVSTDESGTGHRGQARLTVILDGRHATVLLVSNISRLSRRSWRGCTFIEEVVLYKGLRTISVTEAIDTADAATWQMVLMVYGAWH